jgi:hypothetical protein
LPPKLVHERALHLRRRRVGLHAPRVRHPAHDSEAQAVLRRFVPQPALRAVDMRSATKMTMAPAVMVLL